MTGGTRSVVLEIIFSAPKFDNPVAFYYSERDSVRARVNTGEEEAHRSLGEGPDRRNKNDSRRTRRREEAQAGEERIALHIREP